MRHPRRGPLAAHLHARTVRRGHQDFGADWGGTGRGSVAGWEGEDGVLGLPVCGGE